MADGTPLYHANHGNLAGSGTVLNLAALETAVVAMRTQTAPDV
jgi:hypothetical protein